MFKHTLKAAQTANDYKIVVSDSDWSKEWIDLISNQTVGIRINLVQKTVELSVRQLRTGWIQDLIFHILGDGKNQTIGEIRLSPAKRQSYEYVFTVGKLVDHEVDYSLYDRNPLIHYMTFKFDKVSLHSKENHSLAPKVDLTDIDKPTDRVNLME